MLVSLFKIGFDIVDLGFISLTFNELVHFQKNCPGGKVDLGPGSAESKSKYDVIEPLTAAGFYKVIEK